MSRGGKYGIGLGIVIALLFVANLLVGSVAIPVSDVFHILLGGEGGKASWRFIVWEARLPQAMTALLCGSALAVCGLMLQTAFKNPLAGPSILGINSGASLGVAFVMLLFGGSISAGTFSLSGFFSVLAGAFVGAMLIMGLILFFSTLLKSNVMLLITGIMIGYIASSAIALLNFFATAEGVQSYMIWGLGNIGRVRNWLLVITGLLTAITTAFCGPVAFIGLAVPHIARMILRTANHNSLLPVTILSGGAVALLCNLICVLPGEAGIIPLNAVTPIIGAPVIIYVIVSQRNPQHFN